MYSIIYMYVQVVANLQFTRVEEHSLALLCTSYIQVQGGKGIRTG
mgnify:CR=1 FL=1